MIKELPEESKSSLDPIGQELLIQPPIAEVPTNVERQGNLLQDDKRRFERLPEDQKLPNDAPKQV